MTFFSRQDDGMKKSYLGALLAFVLVTGAIALLSLPGETTWIAMYMDNQKLKRAEELLWKHYRRDPGDLATAAKLVDTLEALGESLRAKEIVREVLRQHPDNAEWKRRLAFMLLAENDPSAAAGVLPPHERDREFWLALAQGYHDGSQEELAEQALLTGHEDDADKAEVWRTLASWRAERDDAQGEKDALEEALRHAPDDEDLLARYFRNRSRAGDLPSALRAADRLPKPLGREYLEALYELHRAHEDYQAAREILEELVAREDATTADSLALVSILYLQKELGQAQALLEKLAARADAFSPDETEAFLSQTRAVRSALLLEAAANGDEQAMLGEMAALRALPSPPHPDGLRSLIYACLRLSDFFGAVVEQEKQDAGGNGGHAEERSRFWLEQAKAVWAQYRDMLPPDDPANAHLAADLAERGSDWPAMLAAWQTIARADGSDLRALLGIARASQHLGDYETSWQSLRRAEALATDAADLLALALQAQAVAGALPKGYPQRAEKQRQADALARRSLAQGWNDALALNLFFRALETNDLTEAETLLQTLEGRGLATPLEYLGLAEAQVARELRRSNHEKGAKGSLESVPPGAGRDRAARNALKALEADAPEAWWRLLYVFTALHDRPQVRAILKRLEQAGLPETPDALRQLADAYGFLGDQKRQFALLERRARLSGQVEDWTDIIALRYWGGDYQGALRLLDAAESLHPGNAELAGRRVLTLVDMGRYGQAINVFQRVRRQDPAIDKKMPAESLAALAQACDRNGRPDRARHFFRLSLTREPDNTRAVFGLADLSRREGKTAEAARLLQDFLERHPENLWARVELANVRPAMAKELYESVLAVPPTDAGEKAVQALALWRTGRLREALHVYSELMRDAKRTSSLMCDYAQALMDADKTGEAENILNEAIREFPDQILPRRLLAAIFIRKKEYARAEACLRKALAIDPNNSEILRQLAFVQQAQEKSWTAQKTWRDAGRR